MIQIQMIKKSPIKNYWYKCLINYIPGPIRKTLDIIKNKVVSLFEANITENWRKQTGYRCGNQANQKHKNQSVEEKNKKSFFYKKTKTKWSNQWQNN